jgi:prolipoprotein diacylglyceryltransferase
MFPTLSIGPLVLPVPTLLLLLGIWIGFSLSEKLADSFGAKQAQISSLLIYFLIASLLGARLSYIASFPTVFSRNWLSIVSPNPNMMDWLGGLMFGIFTVGIYISRRKLDLWKTLDALIPALLTFFLFLGFSFLASGQFYGIPTNMPWAINLWGLNRHPTQIYWIIVVGVIMVFIRRSPKAKWYPGIRFLTLVSLSAFSFLILDYFRADGQYILEGLRSAQVFSLLLIIITLVQLGFRIRKFHSEPKKEI